MSIPSRVGAFELKSRKKFEDGSLMLRYTHSSNFSADVFLDGGPDFGSGCDLICATKILHEDTDGFKEAFSEMIRLKYVDTIYVVSDDTLSFPPESTWRIGRHLNLVLRKGSESKTSDFYLFYLPYYKVKVRSTYASDSTGLLRGFLSDLPRALTSPDTSTTEKHISMSTTMQGTIATTVPKVVSALTRLGYTIADSSVQSGRVVTAAVSNTASVPGALQANGKPWPSEVVTVLMSQKADSVDMKIMAIPANYRSDEQKNITVELIALTRVMSELRKEGTK